MMWSGLLHAGDASTTIVHSCQTASMQLYTLLCLRTTPVNACC